MRHFLVRIEGAGVAMQRQATAFATQVCTGQPLLSVAAPKRLASADLGLVALTGAAAVAGALLHRMFKTRPLEAELDLHRGECVE